MTAWTRITAKDFTPGDKIASTRNDTPCEVVAFGTAGDHARFVILRNPDTGKTFRIRPQYTTRFWREA